MSCPASQSASECPLSALGRPGSEPGCLAAWAAAAASLNEPTLPTLPGLRAWAIALLARRARPGLVLITSDLRAASHWHDELEPWFEPEGTALFPERDVLSSDAVVDQVVARQRLRLIHRMRTGTGPRVVVTTPLALDQSIPAEQALEQAVIAFVRGARVDAEALEQTLRKAGWVEVSEVDAPGQFVRRGQVFDGFPLQAARPIRIELDARQQIVALREFAPEDQLRRLNLESSEWLLHVPPPDPNREARRLFEGEWRWLHDPAGTPHAEESARAAGPEAPDPPLGLAHEFLHHATDRIGMSRQMLERWVADGWEVALVANNAGEARHLRETLGPVSERAQWYQSSLEAGFLLPDARWALLTAHEIFNRGHHVRGSRTRLVGQASSRRVAVRPEIIAWEPGDRVVHHQHGIARFLGLMPVNLGGAQDEEALVLEFAQATRMYVPLEQAHLVSRYTTAAGRTPPVDTLGGGRWEKTRLKIHRSVFDYAASLLKIEAERASQPGFAFPPDSPRQAEFEQSFVYAETPDQRRALEEIKDDMMSPRPMDRLLCGDVGFGKTEVAIRAAFKAALAGKQVAFLCPTTVLAQQHGQTLRERMAGYPVTVEVLTRFSRPEQRRAALERVRTGAAQIVVGTHRIVSPDVAFRDLGLLIIDEEQRFGVRAKERLKERFRQVDTLTLSATPIPRTLYLATMGARDISVLQTPPPGRSPVETIVGPFDERVVRAAIRRELARGGQVFYLHNRIESIGATAGRLKVLVPEARLRVAHGRMSATELERVMKEFVEGEADVLASTTLIESGLDIPNANTLLIERADRFGLADLHQLRGRVGRGREQAFAYLFTAPGADAPSGQSDRRLGALRQNNRLGSGIQIALRDLELRGAGNLLGTQQSGHLFEIGFELYSQILSHAIDQARGATRARRDVAMELDFVALREGQTGGAAGGAPGKLPAFLPRRYLPDPWARLAAYRELAQAATVMEVDDLAEQWRDRFGRLPDEAETLVKIVRLRLYCGAKMVTSVQAAGTQLRIKRGGDVLMVGDRLPRLLATEPRERLAEVMGWVERLLNESEPVP